MFCNSITYLWKNQILSILLVWTYYYCSLLFRIIPVIFRFPYLLIFSKSCNIFSKESNEDLSFWGGYGNIKRSTPILIATLSLSILYTLPVSAIKASEPFIQQEQLNQARQLEQWKKDRAVLPRIKVEKAAIEKETQDISPSMAAFYVDEIHLEGLPEELDFLNDKVHAYEKQKLSMNDIETVSYTHLRAHET